MFQNVIKLSESTIYRKVLGYVFLSNVRRHTSIIYTDEMACVIEYLKNNAVTIYDLKKIMTDCYSDPEVTDEYREDIIDELMELGILIND